VKHKKAHPNEDWDVAAAWQRLRDGEPMRDITASLGLNQFVVSRRLAEVYGAAYQQVIDRNRHRRPVQPEVPYGTFAGHHYARGRKYPEIADAMGRSRGAIWDLLRRTPEFQNVQQARAHREAMILRLHAEGLPNNEIGRAVERHPHSIRTWLLRRGLAPNPYRIDARPWSEIWLRFCGGETLKHLARIYDTCPKLIKMRLEQLVGEAEYARVAHRASRRPRLRRRSPV
jgi:hypothetical protein